MSQAYGCVYPSCNCRTFSKTDSKKVQGSLLRYSVLCNECSHAQHLHRPRTETDKLVVQEVSEVAITAGCHGLIPMSCLSRMDHFGPHHLIPVPMDIGSNEEENVVCSCPGFQVKDLGKTLQDFHRLPVAGVHSDLPNLMCTSCPHPLQKHRHQEQRQSAFESVFELISSFSVIEQPLNHELLQLSVSPTGMMVFVGVANSHQDQPGLLVHCCQLTTAGSNAGGEQSVQEDLDTVDSKGEDDEDSASIVQATGVLPEDSPSGQAKGRKRKRKSQRIDPGKVRRSARITARNSACVPDELQSSIDLIDKERKEEKLRTAFMKSSLEMCFKDAAQVIPLDLVGMHLPFEEPVAKNQILAFSVAWLGCSNAPPMLIAAAGIRDGRIIIVNICLDSGRPPSAQSSLSCPKQEGLDHMLTSLALGPTMASSEPVVLPVCAGFSSGTLRFITIGLTDEERKLSSLQSSCCTDPSSSVTKCGWSPNGKYLAAGTQHGRVMVYSKRQSSSGATSDRTRYVLVGEVSCCAAPVTTLCWKSDSSSVIVGSCDNSLHLLTISSMRDNTSKQHSLFKYFEPEHRVNVACQLTGHLSAIASTVFFKEYLLSFGWDSRLLVWPVDCIDDSGELEPLSIFKLGPALSAESVAQAMITMGNFLLVTFCEKGDRVKIVLYHLQQMQR